jgi:thioesterase domain-containing protein
LEDFFALAAEDRRRFFRRKARAMGRKLARRFGAGPAETGVDLDEVIDTGHFPEPELKLWKAHLQALIEHVEKEYDGPVTLLRTRGQPMFCSFADDFCWGKLARGGVQVRSVPGSHENIFMEPNVGSLAVEVSACLEAALQRRESGRASPFVRVPVMDGQLQT